jgi:hypothetical protein
MRGLVEAEGDPRDANATFRVTIDFIRFLGVSSIEELPDYDKLRSHENVVRVLEMAKAGGSKDQPVEEPAAPAE